MALQTAKHADGRNIPHAFIGDFRISRCNVQSRRPLLVLHVPDQYASHHHVPNVIGFSSPNVIFVGTRPCNMTALVCSIQRASVYGWAWIGTPSGVP